MRRVHLYGVLAEKYGGPFDLEVATPRQAVSLLCANFKGFEKDIRAGHFRVVRGDYERGIELDDSMVAMHLGRADLHIEPVIAGAAGRGKGIGKLVVGIALVGLAFASGGLGLTGAGGFLTDIAGSSISISAANIGMFGVALALSGVGQIISPTPNGKTDPHQSFLFGQIQDNVDQGGAIPIVYGRIRVGATMISGEIQTVDDLTPTPGYNDSKS